MAKIKLIRGIQSKGPGESRSLKDKFSGSLLGGMLGDVIGAPVEAESPEYIKKTFQNVDQILALKSVPEIFTGEWEVGLFTDDTQMTLCVAEWLAGKTLDGESLLEQFCIAYEPWRHYGPGTRLILENFKNAKENWRNLATAMFPNGSYGNGSAMRVAPIGLLLHNDLPCLIETAILSSLVTHSHQLALQGAVLQATAVAVAVRMPHETGQFLRMLRGSLFHLEEQGQDTAVYIKALSVIQKGIEKGASPNKMSDLLGNGIKAQEAVPMAIYCYLANPTSFEKAIEAAIFLGGDSDTIASMTGAISGAALGESQIPKRWLERVSEKIHTPAQVGKIASQLFEQGLKTNFSKNRI